MLWQAFGRWGGLVADSGGGSAPTNDPHFASTVLLLSGNGANGSTTFTDESAAARGAASNVVGGTSVDTTIKLFGTGSIEFEAGRNDALEFNDHADWTLGSSDFTIECFAYHFENTQADTLLSHYDSFNNNRGWSFQYRGDLNPDILWFQCTSDGTSGTQFSVSANWTPTVNTWYYYCIERSGSTFRLYAGPAGGTASRLNSGTSSLTIFNSTEELRIGSIHALGALSEGFMGHLDEIRVTLGVARYQNDSGFAVPTAAFPRSA